jgi:hypothetical protein
MHTESMYIHTYIHMHTETHLPTGHRQQRYERSSVLHRAAAPSHTPCALYSPLADTHSVTHTHTHTLEQHTLRTPHAPYIVLWQKHTQCHTHTHTHT